MWMRKMRSIDSDAVNKAAVDEDQVARHCRSGAARDAT
jgi:hypothetical protein